MPAKKILLTPQVADEICNYLIGGAYEHVAAEAAGVPYEIYQRWIAQGDKSLSGKFGGKKTVYRDLALRVRKAKATARLLAETEMREKHPQAWLKCGPGREQPNRPGWSKEVAPVIVEDHRQINILASVEWSKLWDLISQALEEFPAAKLAIAQVLLQHEKGGEPPGPLLIANEAETLPIGQKGE